MNTKTTILNLFLAVIVMTCWTAAAQGPGGQGHRPPTPAIDTVLDTNSDEIISANEMARAKSRLSTLDADTNDRLSFDECMGFSAQGNDSQPPQGGQHGSGGQPPAPPIFSSLDSNNDHFIDAGEMANAVASLQQLDKNGDGELSADEYRPQQPGGQRGGGQMGGGQMRGGQGMR